MAWLQLQGSVTVTVLVMVFVTVVSLAEPSRAGWLCSITLGATSAPLATVEAGSVLEEGAWPA